jgi:hypothetical protein
MRNHMLSVGCLLITLSPLCTFRSGAADEPAKGSQPSLNDLSMEVAVLQAFRQFKFTPGQLETLRKLARETVAEPSGREPGKASAEYRRTLAALRDALTEDDNDDVADELQLQLDELNEKEKPELDDGIEVTEAARLHAPEMLRSLSARQVAYYLANHVDEVPEPLERILAAMDAVRALDAKEWKRLREAVSEEVGRGAAGLDGEKASQVGDKVVQLLIQVRALTEEEFKAQRAELEKMAREIVGNLGPLDVLRHVVAQDIAELLSNPRLQAAIDARLKK